MLWAAPPTARECHGFGTKRTSVAIGLETQPHWRPNPASRQVKKRLYSRRDDVTLANPFGPPVRGLQKIAETLERAASQLRDGEAFAFESSGMVIHFCELRRRTCIEGASHRTDIAP